MNHPQESRMIVGRLRLATFLCLQDRCADVKGQVVNEKRMVGRYFEKVLDIVYIEKQYSSSAGLVTRVLIRMISTTLELLVTTNTNKLRASSTLDIERKVQVLPP